MAPSTPIAAVQFAQLDDQARARIAYETFAILEYDEDGDPGSEWSSDTTQYLGEMFDRYGVQFTDPNRLPTGYRISYHNQPDGTACPHSLQLTAEPHKRTPVGDIRCAAGCPTSTVEAVHANLYPAALCLHDDERILYRYPGMSRSWRHDEEHTCEDAEPAPGTVDFIDVWDAVEARARTLGTWDDALLAVATTRRPEAVTATVATRAAARHPKPAGGTPTPLSSGEIDGRLVNLAMLESTVRGSMASLFLARAVGHLREQFPTAVAVWVDISEDEVQHTNGRPTSTVLRVLDAAGAVIWDADDEDADEIESPATDAIGDAYDSSPRFKLHPLIRLPENTDQDAPGTDSGNDPYLITFAAVDEAASGAMFQVGRTIGRWAS